ncbi:hypothetical protein DLAC_11385 [Tieghemostelium lacteum]|uniref:LAA1-like C-terminal TPR repeats domain-containing protein n=1 Tax=Tieghemostelium lacteum TaxID=361077 RepID=A0A151Z2L5_TIELA|nr:hypothetical protein DLAC_11385 [Tieghemostelium lacteum]|eukprot:KYQ88178.1 hypothetical protein DLAC_11385 [Tieghemostelium lacteum]
MSNQEQANINTTGTTSESFQYLETQFSQLQKAVNVGIKNNNNSNKFDYLSVIGSTIDKLSRIELDSITLKWLTLLVNCLTQSAGTGSQAYSSVIGQLISKLLDQPIGQKSSSTILKNLITQLQSKQTTIAIKCTIMDSLTIIFRNNKTLSIVFLSEMFVQIQKQIKALAANDGYPFKASSMRCLCTLIEASGYSSCTILLDCFKFIKSIYPTTQPNQNIIALTSQPMLLSPLVEFKLETLSTLLPILTYYNQTDVKFESFDDKILLFLSKLDEDNLKLKTRISEIIGNSLSILYYKDRESSSSTPNILSPIVTSQNQSTSSQSTTITTGSTNSSVTTTTTTTNQSVKPKKWNTIETLMNYLSTQFLQNQKKEVKMNLALSFIQLFSHLKLKDIEKSIDLILTILFRLLQVSGQNRSLLTPSDQIQSRSAVSMIIRLGLGERLSEQGQQQMLKHLGNILIQCEQYSEIIVNTALSEVTQLINELGEGGITNPEDLSNQLIQMLSSNSQSIRQHSAIALRSLATNLPKFTSQYLTECLQNLNQLLAEIDKIAVQPDIQKRIMSSLKGYSQGCAALIATIKKTELGVPVQLLNQITKISSTLLQNPDQINAALTLARLESGWIIMNSLLKFMSDTFVESQLNDLMSFWKSSFNITNVHPTSERDIAIFARTRADAMVSLHSFIVYHPKLLNSKVLSQINSFMSSTLKTVTELPAMSSTFQSSTNELTQLLEYNLLRLFQQLPIGSHSGHSSLLTMVTSLILDGPTNSMIKSLLTKDDEETLLPDLSSFYYQLEQEFQIPLSTLDSSLVSCLNLQDCLSHRYQQNLDLLVVNHAIELFGYLFISQPDRHRIQLIDHISNQIRDCTNNQQKTTMIVNSLTCLLVILKSMSLNNHRFQKSDIIQCVQRFLQKYFQETNPLLRRLSSECLGLLCRVEGDMHTQTLIQSLNEITKKPPKEVNSSVRAGCAFVLGCIQRSIGGMMSTDYLPTILSILHNLAKDTLSQDVSTYALHSLYVTIQTSGFTFNDFAAPTMALVQSLLVSENPPYQLLGRIVNSIVVALGPELESKDILGRCLSTSMVIQNSSDPQIRVEAIYFYQKLIIFAPNAIRDQELILYLITQLHSQYLSLRIASVTCLRQLIQKRSSFEMNIQLFEKLFMMIDTERDQKIQKELKLLIFTLIDTIAPSNPSSWLNLSMSIILSSKSTDSKLNQSSVTTTATASSNTHSLNSSTSTTNTTKHTTSKDAQSPPEDEEEEEEEMSKKVVIEKSDSPVEYVHRWFTKVFALECVRKVIQVVRNKPEHFNLVVNHPHNSSTTAQQHIRLDYLVYQLHDLISISYKAAISQIDSMRPVGILLLKDILDGFAKTQDPDYEGHLLLELYQAQIMSALRPAFAPGALPTQLSIGCSVFVSFLESSLHYDSVAIKKICTLLAASIKDLRELNFPNYNEKTTTLVQLSILKAFAQLYLLIQKNKSLNEILSPVISPLLKYLRVHWIQFLKEYSLLILYSSQVYTMCKPIFFSPLTYQDSIDYFKDSYPPILKALSYLLNQTTYWLEGRKEGDEYRMGLSVVEKEFLNETTPNDDFNIILGLSLLSMEKYLEDPLELNFNVDSIAFSLKILLLLFQPPLGDNQKSMDHISSEKFQDLFQILLRIINFNSLKIHNLILNILNNIINLNLIKNNQIFNLILTIVLKPINIFKREEEGDESVDYLVSMYPLLINILKLIESETEIFIRYLPLFLSIVFQGLNRSNNSNLITNAIQMSNFIFKNFKSTIPIGTFNLTITTLVNQLLIDSSNSSSSSNQKNGLVLLLSILILNSPSSLELKILQDLILVFKNNLSSTNLSNKDKILYLQVLRNIVNSSSQQQNQPYLFNFVSSLVQELFTTLLSLLKYPTSSNSLQLDEIDMNNEIIKIIVQSNNFSSENHKTQLLMIIIQSLILFLQPNSNSNSVFHGPVLQILLNFAQINATQFKEALSQIPVDLKMILEHSIRQSIQNQQTKVELKTPSKPQIQLTFDFSKNIN